MKDRYPKFINDIENETVKLQKKGISGGHAINIILMKIQKD